MNRLLGNIDRRVIYTLILIGTIIPFLVTIPIKVKVSPPVKSSYEAVDRIPEKGVILISIDYDPTSSPEIQPMLIAILRHAFRKNLKVIMMGHLILGLPMGEMALKQVAKEFHKEYGVDYVNLGYRPGYSAVMLGMGKEIRDFFSRDVYGTPLDSIPMMKNVHNYNNIDLLVDLTHGYSGELWIQTAGARFGQKIIIGCTGVVAPDIYPYLDAGQIEGLIGGLQGASEYESLIKTYGTAVRGMPVQSIVHGIIIIFIILGNIGYYITRRKKK